MTGGRITGFGRLPLPEYIDLANRQTPIIPMIESRAGVDALGDILQLDGVGMIMEGALDLASISAWGLILSILGSGKPCRHGRRLSWRRRRFLRQPPHRRTERAMARPRRAQFSAGEDRGGLLHNALKARLHSLQQQ